jgi:hypothetical protein
MPVEGPSWLRPSPGEHRRPAAVAILVGILIQVLAPAPVVPSTRLLLPGLEIVLLAALVLVNPFRMNLESRVVRWMSLVLTGALGVSNGWSAWLLVQYLMSGQPLSAGTLLLMGAAVWTTNVLAFGLIFWELDRGGPAARAAARHENPDFLFPQMSSPELAPADWRPWFLDYLYLSFTNATAFSPTDVMPLTIRAKVAMAAQSLVALVVVLLVVARAINVLK